MALAELLSRRPIVAACGFDRLSAAVQSPAAAILVMSCRIQDLRSREYQVAREAKPCLLHFDFIKGVSADREAVALVRDFATPTAIVSTKGPVLRAAQREGIAVVQRIFLIDTLSLQKSIASIEENSPDAVEIMPGVVHSILPLIRSQISQPIMVGGLIYSTGLVRAAFEAGADAVSMSDQQLWTASSYQELTSGSHRPNLRSKN